MADIFISYASEDREKAKQLAQALEAQGWSVWWDRNILAGRRFSDVIDEALAAAQCVVVLWSAASIKKDWVIEEAEDGKERGVLVPVFIEPEIRPPRGFRRIQAQALSRWDGEAESTPFQSLASAVRHLVSPGQADAAIASEPPATSKATLTNPTELPPDLSDDAREKMLKPLAEFWFQLRSLNTFQDTLKDGSKGPAMIKFRALSFTMGSPEEEVGRKKNEGPQHPVTFAKPFALGKYAVMFAEYDQYCALTGCDPPNDEGWGRENRPVINVSWDDAVAYCEWLSAQTGKRYRLPSEAEWEYAARAGTTMAYSWGDKVGKNRANCAGCGSQWDGKQTAPVGSFKANAFGLHDMSGNVYEWVQDCWHEDYTDAPADGLAWEAGGGSSERVVRGGSWYGRPEFMRSATRFRLTPGLRDVSVGFRLAQDL